MYLHFLFLIIFFVRHGDFLCGVWKKIDNTLQIVVEGNQWPFLDMIVKLILDLGSLYVTRLVDYICISFAKNREYTSMWSFSNNVSFIFN